MGAHRPAAPAPASPSTAVPRAVLPTDDRAALRGIVYVLCKGVSWKDVSAERKMTAQPNQPARSTDPIDPTVPEIRHLLGTLLNPTSGVVTLADRPWDDLGVDRAG